MNRGWLTFPPTARGSPVSKGSVPSLRCAWSCSTPALPPASSSATIAWAFLFPGPWGHRRGHLLPDLGVPPLSTFRGRPLLEPPRSEGEIVLPPSPAADPAGVLGRPDVAR